MSKFFIQDINFEKDIGANGVAIEFGPFRFVIDAGLDPKRLGNKALPNFGLLPKNSVDFVVLTHCHLDHLGSLPVLMAQQTKAKVLLSYPTSLLAPQMLENSYTVMCRQREEKHIDEYPLFDKNAIVRLQKSFFTLKFGQPYTLEKEGEKAKITLFQAGHILGASSVLLEYQGRQLLITGDILFSDQNSLRGARIPRLEGLDVLLLETTRGGTERTASRRNEEQRLLKVVRKTIKRGGICLIPAFALGRIQELLVLFYNAKKEHKLPECPIFCSGLGMALVNIFDTIGKQSASVNFSRQILKQLNIKSLRRKKIDPRTTKLKAPAIYLVSSGMLVEHTPAYNIASCILKDNKNSICFVGYCDENTPGGQLLQTKANDIFRFDELDYETPVRAQVDRFDLSGHADRGDLCQFVFAQKPKMVVLTHGDEEARRWFKEQFKQESFSILDPDVGKCYEL